MPPLSGSQAGAGAAANTTRGIRHPATNNPKVNLWKRFIENILPQKGAAGGAIRRVSETL